MDSALRIFDAIRPFEPEELPEVYERLLNNEEFQAVLRYLYPSVPLDAIAQKMRACPTSLDFQKAFCYDFIKQLLSKAARGCEIDVSAIDVKRRHTFVSNHRDIVLDSGLLDVLLIEAGSDTTCEIAIGDNLLSLPWVKDLVRINKSFIVQRGLQPRDMFAASQLMSAYMHYVIEQKQDNIWIAQRSGRAKDSDDRTSEAVLKMMTMGGKGSVIDRLKTLRIVPLSISYEYDPCDYLKAQEYQQRRDNPQWAKGQMDDVISMQTGIMGFKGHIHYQCAPCINDFLDTLPEGISKGDVFKSVALHIDREIHRNYEIYASNYIALDLLRGDEAMASHYTKEEKAFFENYLAGQMAKITLANKDEAFLRERILTMYANPLINHLAALEG